MCSHVFRTALTSALILALAAGSGCGQARCADDQTAIPRRRLGVLRRRKRDLDRRARPRPRRYRRTPPGQGLRPHQDHRAGAAPRTRPPSRRRGPARPRPDHRRRCRHRLPAARAVAAAGQQHPLRHRPLRQAARTHMRRPDVAGVDHPTHRRLPRRTRRRKQVRTHADHRAVHRRQGPRPRHPPGLATRRPQRRPARRPSRRRPRPVANRAQRPPTAAAAQSRR